MKLQEKILNFIFPSFCIFCNREDYASHITGVCKRCCSDLKPFPNFESNRCQVCLNPLDLGESCEYCNSRNVFFQRSWSIRSKGNLEKQVMNRLKFQNERVLSRFFGMNLGPILPKIRKIGINCIIPVPSHSSSHGKRPYLGIEILAKRLSEKLDIPILDCIEKKSKKHQSSLTRQDRFFHAKDAFILKKNALLNNNTKILLLDDVFTTGASVNEISRLLLEGGSHSVYLMTATRPEEGIEV